LQHVASKCACKITKILLMPYPFGQN